MTDQAQNLREIMNKSDDTRIITVTSGKGGVGKSSISLNLAIELSRRGKRVLLIDSDFGFSNIDIMLGVSTKYNLLHVLDDKKDIFDIIEEGVGGVKFISGGSGMYDLIKMDTFQINKLINGFKRLENIADYIIFDTGAGASDNILRMIHASHETFIVTTPEPTSITDAYALIKIACGKTVKPSMHLIMNRAKSKKEADITMEGFIAVVNRYMGLKIERLGHILEDVNMANAVKIQKPLMVSYPKSNAAINIETIVDEYLKAPRKKKGIGIAGFFSRLLNTEDKEIIYTGDNDGIESSGELR